MIFKYAINKAPLVENDINILVYLTDIDSNKDILVHTASINVGEIYVNKPISTYIPLQNLKKVNLINL